MDASCRPRLEGVNQMNSPCPLTPANHAIFFPGGPIAVGTHNSCRSRHQPRSTQFTPIVSPSVHQRTGYGEEARNGTQQEAWSARSSGSAPPQRSRPPIWPSISRRRCGRSMPRERGGGGGGGLGRRTASSRRSSWCTATPNQAAVRPSSRSEAYGDNTLLRHESSQSFSKYMR